MKRAHRNAHRLAWIIITPLLLLALLGGVGQYRQALPAKNLPAKNLPAKNLPAKNLTGDNLTGDSATTAVIGKGPLP